MKAEIIPYTLIFKTPGGTSRGVLKTKDTWILNLQEKGAIGWGEIGLFRGLSCDDKPEFESKLVELKSLIESGVELAQLLQTFIDWPSIRFGIEQAFTSLSSDSPFSLIDSDFLKKSDPIDINGLVWMGDIDFMKSQLDEKLRKGFHCIKLKIGAINFDREIELIENIRKSYSEKEVEIRVDANGAFGIDDVQIKLQRLADLKIHSIEQPIKQGQIDEMSVLCSGTPLPIALDEELIGVNYFDEKVELLTVVKPQFIILKPSLLGGWKSCDEWIEIAENLNIGWWITSALESNIGLNAIAQYVAVKQTKMPQGLGTGELFGNNFPAPLRVDNGALYYDSEISWDLNLLIKNKIHPSFRINGFDCDAFLNLSFDNQRLKAFQKELLIFKSSHEFVFQTSGTTGASKQINFSFEQIKASAKATHKTFDLSEGAIVVNALPLQYVASKMMLYRALICGYSLHLIEPDFDEAAFNDLSDEIEFIPLVPLQVRKIMGFKNNPFQSIQSVLIGGASVSSDLKENILSMDTKTKFFESFGSTETLTHIAIKELIESSSNFKSIEGVSFSKEDECLIIHAPHLQEAPIITSDLVELSSKHSFKWLGRADNVINSGGIKIIPEQIELQIARLVKKPFFVASEPSELLGQQIIMVIESPTKFEINWSEIDLNKYEIPKKIYFIPQFSKTDSGKILRSECLNRIHV